MKIFTNIISSKEKTKTKILRKILNEFNSLAESTNKILIKKKKK